MKYPIPACLRPSLILAALLLCTVTVARWPPALMDPEGSPTLAPVLEVAAAAVVNVRTERRIRSRSIFFYGDTYLQEGGGSGVIIDAEKGLIVTNNHVVDGAQTIYVTLRDQREMEAKLVGSDRETDIALLRVDAANLTAISFRDSNELRVGDFVIAIGSPFGLPETVTYGIVSAKGRRNVTGSGIENFIQTDAAINPGNSGGALIDLKGRLVGINTLIYSPRGGNVGIGFAIPANMARTIVGQLLEHGDFKQGFLGIIMENTPRDLMTSQEAGAGHGVKIAQVYYGSSAAKAGLQPGEVVTALDGTEIDGVEDLWSRIVLKRPGDKVGIEVLKNEERRIVEAILSPATLSRHPMPASINLLQGAFFSDTDPSRQYKGHGVVLETIQPGSKASSSGLREGDLVFAVNEVAIENVWHLIDELHEADSIGAEITFLFKRDSAPHRLVLAQPPIVVRLPYWP